MMEFTGFTNSDFDFFRKKGSLNKSELDDKKEEIKKHFREFCYQIQKSYHSTTSGTLVLDKDFQGLGKNKNSIYACNKFADKELFSLYIIFSKEGISISLACPDDDDITKFSQLKNSIKDNGKVLANFFKENKNMFLSLYSINNKKHSENTWTEVYKFSNNEMCHADYSLLLSNMEKLQPSEAGCNTMAGLRISSQYLKTDAVRIGKNLPERANADIIRLLALYEDMKLC